MACFTLLGLRHLVVVNEVSLCVASSRAATWTTQPGTAAGAETRSPMLPSGLSPMVRLLLTLEEGGRATL